MKRIVIDNNVFFEQLCSRIAEGESVMLKLRGNSMLPLLRNGKDNLLLAPVPHGYVFEKDEVLLFRYNGSFVLHRVVRSTGDDLLMQGDNCVSQEHISSRDVVARLIAVQRPNKKMLSTDGWAWKSLSKGAVLYRWLKNAAYRCLNRNNRRYLSVAYFILLFFLMWAPINGMGLRLDNFVLGIRADHLLHASVFLFCAFFLMDWLRYRPFAVWLTALAVSVATESVQLLLPFRAFDVNDLLANFIGVSVGMVLVLPYVNRKRSSLLCRK